MPQSSSALEIYVLMLMSRVSSEFFHLVTCCDKTEITLVIVTETCHEGFKGIHKNKWKIIVLINIFNTAVCFIETLNFGGDFSDMMCNTALVQDYACSCVILFYINV